MISFKTFEFWNFVFVSDFGFRISDFRFNRFRGRGKISNASKFCLLLSLYCLGTLFSAAVTQAQVPFWQPVPIRSEEQKAAGLAGGEGFQMVYAIA